MAERTKEMSASHLAADGTSLAHGGVGGLSPSFRSDLFALLRFARSLAQTMDAPPPKNNRKAWETGMHDLKILGDACEPLGTNTYRRRCVQLATALKENNAARQQQHNNNDHAEKRTMRHRTRAPWTSGWEDETPPRQKGSGFVLASQSVTPRRASVGLWHGSPCPLSLRAASETGSRVDADAYQVLVPPAPEPGPSRRDAAFAGVQIDVPSTAAKLPEAVPNASPDERARRIEEAHAAVALHLGKNAAELLGLDACGWPPGVSNAPPRASWSDAEVKAFLDHVKEPYEGDTPKGRFEAVLDALRPLAHEDGESAPDAVEMDQRAQPSKSLAECVFFYYNAWKTHAHPMCREHFIMTTKKARARNVAKRREKRKQAAKDVIAFVRRHSQGPGGLNTRPNYTKSGSLVLLAMQALAKVQWPDASQRNLATPAWVTLDGYAIEDPTATSAPNVVHVKRESLPQRKKRQRSLHESFADVADGAADGKRTRIVGQTSAEAGAEPPRSPPPPPKPAGPPPDPRDQVPPASTPDGTPWYVPTRYSASTQRPVSTANLLGRYIMLKWDPGEEGGWAVGRVIKNVKAWCVIVAYRDLSDDTEEHYKHGLDLKHYTSEGDENGKLPSGSWCVLEEA